MSTNLPEPSSEPDVTTAMELLREAISAANVVSDSVDAGTDIALVNEDAAAVKLRFAASHAKVAKARELVAAAQKNARAEIERQQQVLKEMERRMLAELAPLEEQAARLKDGIGALNLYLGRDEWIETLRTGTPADVSVPLTIRQSVLAMDEESALHAEDGGIDFKSVHLFDEWILGDPSRLDQVLPEQRGVVAIMARRSDVDYGNPWENKAKNERNHETWWLIRNGGNLYRIVISEFSVGARLIPRADEFTGLFLESDGLGGKRTIDPGSSRWLAAEKTADARTRHYMKIALVLQGLVARTAIFHPLPHPELSLLEQRFYDEGFVHLIADDELAIGQGRPDFRTWLKAINANIRVGARVVGQWKHEYTDRDRDSRVHPKYAKFPTPLSTQVVNRETNPGEFRFAYDRNETTYDRESWVERDIKTKATYGFEKSETTIIAIDFVSASEIRYYLESRSERRSYLDMFPVLRAALVALEAEESDEKPFRDLLRIAVAATLGVADATETADDLIRWWKIANKWNRALNGNPEAEARAVRVIVAEAKRRAKTAAAGTNETLVKALLSEHDNVILIARRTNDYIIVQKVIRPWATADAEGNQFHATAVPGNVFVNLIIANAKGIVKETRTWETVSRAQLAKWEILHEVPEWATWRLGSKRGDFITDPEITALAIDPILARVYANGWKPYGISIQSKDPNSNNFITGKIYFNDPTELPIPAVEGRELTGEPSIVFATSSLSFGLNRKGRKLWNGRDWNREIWRGKTTPTPPWATHNEKYQMVWLDQKVIAETSELAAAWAAADTRRGALQQTVRKMVEGISIAWKVRETEIARLRFIEDFADPDLWEGHSKTISIFSPMVAGGRKSNVAYQDKADWPNLTGAVAQLVEAGKAPYGLTVLEAFGAAALSEFDATIGDLRFPEQSEAAI